MNKFTTKELMEELILRIHKKQYKIDISKDDRFSLGSHLQIDNNNVIMAHAKDDKDNLVTLTITHPDCVTADNRMGFKGVLK